jgi:hypothetical protein
VVDQVGAYTWCVYQRIDPVSLKLRSWPDARAHEDGWRSDRASGKGDSVSIKPLRRTARFDVDANGAAVFNYDSLYQTSTAK